MVDIDVYKQGNQMKVEYRGKRKKLDFRYNDIDVEEDKVQLWNKDPASAGKTKAGKFKRRFNGWEYIVESAHQYHRIKVPSDLIRRLKRTKDDI